MRIPRTTISSPELLEPRIAPAAVFTYTDNDGDLVSVKSSVGTNAQLAAAVNLDASSHQLNKLDLNAVNATTSKQIFADAIITITAAPQKDQNGVFHGDGFANVGFINANKIDLTSVTIHGDLGRILVGNADKHVGIGSLT